MKTNENLQKDVQNAIKWEPLLNAAEIGVTAKDGVITLTGTVDSYAKKLGAEHATKNVAGVNAVVEKIDIVYGSSSKKTDNEIATEVLSALKWNWEVPNDKVKVKVEKGWVTLDGELKWNFQKEAAKSAIKNLMGVIGVSNDIKIKSETHDAIEKKEIEDAIARNWSINNHDIHVKVNGTKVTLSGTVSSWYQKDEAARIAWNAPGVWNVDNELVVEYEYAMID
ncbi:MAG: BON domain-containing protein [Bacteroidia bacterium]|nr:BON domain-containing protein [Bacteroidia bacterium]